MGTVFSVNTDGGGFTNLHNFFGDDDGANPLAGLILSGNTLYGASAGGRFTGPGNVFKINADGTGFSNLYGFGSPAASLTLSGNTLYGTSSTFGGSGYGLVFGINTDGSGFTNLHGFNGVSDGGYPNASLVLSGGILYGATRGGSSGKGTVFAINTDGSGFTNLHSFTGGSDGVAPNAGLILSGNTLYGTTYIGNTVFAVNTDGSGFTNLYHFNGSDGSTPYAGLILSGNTLYGTTCYGGSSGKGTVFSLSLPVPQLKIIRSGTNVIMTWPTNAAGFSYAGYTLQSTTNLPSTNWSPVPDAPAIVGNQFCVTNSPAASALFYRLRGN